MAFGAFVVFFHGYPLLVTCGTVVTRTTPLNAEREMARERGVCRKTGQPQRATELPAAARRLARAKRVHRATRQRGPVVQTVLETQGFTFPHEARDDKEPYPSRRVTRAGQNTLAYIMRVAGASRNLAIMPTQSLLEVVGGAHVRVLLDNSGRRNRSLEDNDAVDGPRRGHAKNTYFSMHTLLYPYEVTSPIPS